MGVFGVESDGYFEGVVLLMEALVEPPMVKHCPGIRN
jgi:hypothetical protein